MTPEELYAVWRSEHLPHLVARFELDGIPDKPARRESWNNWIDSLARDGAITQEVADETGHPEGLETVRPSDDDLRAAIDAAVDSERGLEIRVVDDDRLLEAVSALIFGLAGADE